MTEIARAESWEALRDAHRWDIPARYNIAWDICDKWAAREPGRLALIHPHAGGVREYSFGELKQLSDRLANMLAAHGVARGDRVGVLLPQSPEALLTHLAAYKLGAVVVPLFTQFGADGLLYRIGHSGVSALVTDDANLPKIAEIRDGLGGLRHVFSVTGASDHALPFWPLLEKASDSLAMADTGPDDPAFISYTSGTTGPPKGALHGHRVLLGHVPGVQAVHEFFPRPGDRMWTPADWAWMGGLCNIAMPSLRFGVPLVAFRMERFDPEEAFALMARHGVRNVFFPPTALKLMRRVENPGRFGHALRSVGSGGESLGAETVEWGREAFGLTINEFYGQTECNIVLANCASIMEVRLGSMGKPTPGSDVTILDAEGNELPPGETGEIAIHKRDAAMFLGYWQEPEKTAEKFVGPWMRTGDEGSRDAEGYFWFGSRTDDVITSSGYRVGPSEIEHCLAAHPAVTVAACIGVPDPVRTEVVRAFVKLSPGVNGSPELEEELRLHVRSRLSPHVAPRQVTFVDEIPTTATGKLLRRELRRKALDGEI